MSWNREGQVVTGMYLGEYRCAGTVTSSRVKYGGKVQHTVELFEPMVLPYNSSFGSNRRALLDEEELVHD